MRKTVEIASIVDRANRMFAHPGTTRTDREAVFQFVAATLSEIHAYTGYQYLPSEFDSEGNLRDGYDQTRVRLYGGSD